MRAWRTRWDFCAPGLTRSSAASTRRRILLPQTAIRWRQVIDNKKCRSLELSRKDFTPLSHEKSIHEKSVHDRSILEKFNLKGRTALVTGSSRGLGAGIA